jgi:hypothetical protein
MERTVRVTRSGARPFWLSALHNGAETVLDEPQHLLGTLDDYAHLVVVLAARQTGTVRGRTHLYQEDRPRRERGEFKHPAIVLERPGSCGGFSHHVRFRALS